MRRLAPQGTQERAACPLFLFLPSRFPVVSPIVRTQQDPRAKAQNWFAVSLGPIAKAGERVMWSRAESLLLAVYYNS